MRAAALATLACLFLSGCDALSHPLKLAIGGRSPKPLEYQYHYLALEMKSSKPCLLISPRALLYGHLNPPGSRYSLLRSGCFHYLAANTRQPDLCSRAVDVAPWIERKNVPRQERCLYDSIHNIAHYGNNINLSIILTAMEYSETEIERILRRPWRTLPTEEFFHRIDRLPHYGSAEDLREMRAMVWQPPPPPPPDPPIIGDCPEAESTPDEFRGTGVCVRQLSPRHFSGARNWDDEGEDED